MTITDTGLVNALCAFALTLAARSRHWVASRFSGAIVPWTRMLVRRAEGQPLI